MYFKTLKRWGPLIVLVICMAVVYAAGLDEKLSLQFLQAHKASLLNAVMAQPLATALAFIVIYIVFVALSIPAATLLSLAAGFLFGPWLGTFYVVIAATIGATIVFFIAKTSIGASLREKAGRLYKRIEKNMNNNAAGYLLFMRLVPIFPFFLVNVVPALFNVKPQTFILTTFFGIMPGSFVYVNLGGRLAEIKNPNDLLSSETLLAFALLGIFALIPGIYKRLNGMKNNTPLVMAALLFTTHQFYTSDRFSCFLDLRPANTWQWTKITDSEFREYRHSEWSVEFAQNLKRSFFHMRDTNPLAHQSIWHKQRIWHKREPT